MGPSLVVCALIQYRVIQRPTALKSKIKIVDRGLLGRTGSMHHALN